MDGRTDGQTNLLPRLVRAMHTRRAIKIGSRRHISLHYTKWHDNCTHCRHIFYTDCSILGGIIDETVIESTVIAISPQCREMMSNLANVRFRIHDISPFDVGVE